jgi:hypothetical protein
MIELSIWDTSFINIINSKTNQIAFFYSVFYAQHEYDIEFHFSKHLAKLKSDKYVKNSDFVE